MATLDELPAAYQAAGRGLELPYFYGTPVAYRTIDELEQVESWREADPECRRRHAALWIWCATVHGVKYGFGQMARSRARALANWQNDPGQFSHPDVSFHVEDPARGLLPVACDNVGTGPGGSPPDGFNLLRSVAGQFGLHTVSGASERHHTQLFPGSKRSWNDNPRPVSTWTNYPVLPGDEGDDDMPSSEEVAQAVWHDETDNLTTGQKDEFWWIVSETHRLASEANRIANLAHQEAAAAHKDTQAILGSLNARPKV